MTMRRERTRRSAGNAGTGESSGVTAAPATATRKAQTSSAACACVFDRTSVFLDSGQEMDKSKMSLCVIFFPFF